MKTIFDRKTFLEYWSKRIIELGDLKLPEHELNVRINDVQWELDSIVVKMADIHFGVEK